MASDMSPHPLNAAVTRLLREVAAEVVLPRFRNLAAHEVGEKSPGEWVTIADHESELRLNEGLSQLLPEARLIGEEACAADPGLLDHLGDGMVWLVDPIDGTQNFKEGITPFGLMVALLADGEALASWLYDPVTGRLCHAAVGQGAWVDGERVQARETCHELPLASIAMGFLPAERRADIAGRAAGRLEIVPIPRCAAEQYPRLVLGQNDIALFERILPWDHVPGALFVTEAGGMIARPDGSPLYATDHRPGLIGAASTRLWDLAVEILFD